MATRCKFTCVSRREFIGWAGDKKILFDYEFNVVTGDSLENKKFWEWTPSGKLNVATVKDGTFEVGRSYYIDISEAE